MPLPLQRVKAQEHLEACGFTGNISDALCLLDGTLHLDENLKEIRARLKLKSPEEAAEEETAADCEAEAAVIVEQGIQAVAEIVRALKVAEREAKHERRRANAEKRFKESVWDEMTLLQKRLTVAESGAAVATAPEPPAPPPGPPSVPWSAFARVVAIAEAYGARVPFDLLTG